MRRVLCMVLLLGGATVAQRPSPDLLKHWEYDRKAPLDVRPAGVQDREGVKVYDVTYAVPVDERAKSIGPNQERVPTYIVVPKGKGPFPAVVYGHWCMPGSKQSDRTEFLDEALVLAHSGALSILPDHVIARKGFVADATPLNTQQIDVMVQQVINLRRAADLLTSRADVDAKRLAYVGHSCNAEMGAFLSGIDKRFKAFVIMAGPLSDEVDLRSSPYQAYRSKVGPEKFDAFVTKYSWTDPGKYVSHSQGVPKLLQFATDEPSLNPTQARKYLPYVSDPKTLKIYTAPHALNDEATRDRIGFLAEQLKFPVPDERRMATIPPLFQPPWPKPPDASESDRDKKKDQ